MATTGSVGSLRAALTYENEQLKREQYGAALDDIGFSAAVFQRVQANGGSMASNKRPDQFLVHTVVEAMRHVLQAAQAAATSAGIVAAGAGTVLVELLLFDTATWAKHVATASLDGSVASARFVARATVESLRNIAGNVLTLPFELAERAAGAASQLIPTRGHWLIRVKQQQEMFGAYNINADDVAQHGANESTLTVPLYDQADLAHYLETHFPLASMLWVVAGSGLKRTEVALRRVTLALRFRPTPVESRIGYSVGETLHATDTLPVAAPLESDAASSSGGGGGDASQHVRAHLQGDSLVEAVQSGVQAAFDALTGDNEMSGYVSGAQWTPLPVGALVNDGVQHAKPVSSPAFARMALQVAVAAYVYRNRVELLRRANAYAAAASGGYDAQQNSSVLDHSHGVCALYSLARDLAADGEHAIVTALRTKTFAGAPTNGLLPTLRQLFDDQSGLGSCMFDQRPQALLDEVLSATGDEHLRADTSPESMRERIEAFVARQLAELRPIGAPGEQRAVSAVADLVLQLAIPNLHEHVDRLLRGVFRMSQFQFVGFAPAFLDTLRSSQQAIKDAKGEYVFALSAPLQEMARALRTIVLLTRTAELGSASDTGETLASNLTNGSDLLRGDDSVVRALVFLQQSTAVMQFTQALAYVDRSMRRSGEQVPVRADVFDARSPLGGVVYVERNALADVLSGSGGGDLDTADAGNGLLEVHYSVTNSDAEARRHLLLMWEVVTGFSAAIEFSLPASVLRGAAQQQLDRRIVLGALCELYYRSDSGVLEPSVRVPHSELLARLLAAARRSNSASLARARDTRLAESERSIVAAAELTARLLAAKDYAGAAFVPLVGSMPALAQGLQAIRVRVHADSQNMQLDVEMLDSPTLDGRVLAVREAMLYPTLDNTGGATYALMRQSDREPLALLYAQRVQYKSALEQGTVRTIPALMFNCTLWVRHEDAMRLRREQNTQLMLQHSQNPIAAAVDIELHNPYGASASRVDTLLGVSDAVTTADGPRADLQAKRSPLIGPPLYTHGSDHHGPIRTLAEVATYPFAAALHSLLVDSPHYAIYEPLRLGALYPLHHHYYHLPSVVLGPRHRHGLGGGRGPRRHHPWHGNPRARPVRDAIGTGSSDAAAAGASA
jgi:hypothetical protein